MEENLYDAIELVNNSIAAYCHYITPNDLGITGGHQCGFYFPHSVEPMFYGSFQERGRNFDKSISIRWQKDFTTQSRAVYYGVGTRNENRITRFGRGFEFLEDKYLGSLQIVTKNDSEDFDCYILSNQDNIEAFIATFSLDITAKNQVIYKNDILESPEKIIEKEIKQYITNINDFPSTEVMSLEAQRVIEVAYKYTKEDITKQPDTILQKWITAEFQLFRNIENKVYKELLTKPFANCQSLIDFSNSILNRRKSRAGKSLEHHLAKIFTSYSLKFEAQAITEGKKRPDFIFPDGESYHNILFPAKKLIMLGAKTTCKDRWRQILNEANRIDHKHLFTLQPGVSKNQLEEMKAEHLTLVVPKDNISLFHPNYRENIISLSAFCSMVKDMQMA